MGSQRTDTIKNQVIQNARKLIGTPFRHTGRSSLGVDCGGLLYLAFGRAGFHIPENDGSYYSVAWWKHTDAEPRLYNFLKKAGFIFLSNNESIDKCDIVCFKLFGEKYPAHHCGIMIDQNHFIHAKCGWGSDDKKVGFDPLHPSYYERLESVMRYKEF